MLHCCTLYAGGFQHLMHGAAAGGAGRVSSILRARSMLL
jgi:hypothetical protein